MSTLETGQEDFRESMMGDFLDESGQLLDHLNEKLLQLDEWVRSLDDVECRDCNPDLLNEMFRSAHSLKGLSAMLGLTNINQLTHKIENVFDATRKGTLVVNGELMEVMFRSVDRLGSLVNALKEPDAEPIECDSVVESIRQILQSAGVERQQGSQAEMDRVLAAAQEAVSAVRSDPPADCDKPKVVSEPAPAPAIPAIPAMPAAVAPAQSPALTEEEAELSEKYLSLFIDETELTLDNLTETLLNGEGGSNRATVEHLLLISHQIKGNAASIGLHDVATLAHRMEDAFQELIDSGAALSAELSDVLLLCTDALRKYVADLRQSGACCDNFDDLICALRLAYPAAAPGSDADAPPSISNLAPELLRAIAFAAPPGHTVLAGQVNFQPGLMLAGLKAELLFQKLTRWGDVCYFSPPSESLEELDSLEAIQFGLATETPLEAVREGLEVAGVASVVIEPVASEAALSSNARSANRATHEPAPAAATVVAHPGDGKARPAETLRVDTERLDHLMNLAGQLVIARARFSQIGDRMRGLAGNKHAANVLDRAVETSTRMAAITIRDDGPHLQEQLLAARSHARSLQTELERARKELAALANLGSTANDLIEAVHQLKLVSDGIQKSVMDIRMVPIGPLFIRFKRVIRDITRLNGKDVHLVIGGEKTELDKRMIDELGDPLIHMVRNAADHGIEPPDVREAAGKPRQGTVTLNAFHRGNSIIIQVSDDGKGLDAERIRRKCIEKGLFSEADAEKMTTQQLHQMIWEPGLSTAEKVTEVSGRGMGMDIVKSKIEGINGTVDVESEPGKGSMFTIRLPLTLAILPSLVAEIDHDIFALPMESVIEIVSISKRDLTSVHGQQMARVRQRVISVVRLDDVFTWNRSHSRPKDPDGETATLVVVGERGRELGLTVTRVIGEEDVVIKSMAENYKNVPGVAGASILGDGRVSLILDIEAVIDMASRAAAARSATQALSTSGDRS